MNKIKSCILKIIARIYVKRQCRHYKYGYVFNSIYYSSAFAKCGKNLRIFGSPFIQKPELIHVGDNCSINEGVQINPNGRIYIGNNVTISSGVQIIANSLDTKNWRRDRLDKVIPHIEGGRYKDSRWHMVVYKFNSFAGSKY